MSHRGPDHRRPSAQPGTLTVVVMAVLAAAATQMPAQAQEPAPRPAPVRGGLVPRPGPPVMQLETDRTPLPTRSLGPATGGLQRSPAPGPTRSPLQATPPGDAATGKPKQSPFRQREMPTVTGGLTRDEMLRKFDLNSDGKIDEGEAERARARMRRERIEAAQQSGIDPLTGRPRAAAAADNGRSAGPTALGGPARGGDELLLLPGTPGTDMPPARPRPSEKAERGPAAAEQTRVPSSVTPQPLTGGVRAGAPAVRPGYGALGPKPDLNAGRQPFVAQPPNGRTAAAPQGRVSSPTGPQTRSAVPGQPQAGGRLPTGGRPAPSTGGPSRAPTTRPGLFPQQSGSRITAEDIGR